MPSYSHGHPLIRIVKPYRRTAQTRAWTSSRFNLPTWEAYPVWRENRRRRQLLLSLIVSGGTVEHRLVPTRLNREGNADNL